MSKELPIYDGKTGTYINALMDDADYSLVQRWKWHTDANGYARRNISYRDETGRVRYKTVLMHRFILNIVNVHDDEQCVDHINGNRLDNRRSNLRIVSLSLNASNRHVVLASSGVLRVSKVQGRYVSRIRNDKTSYYLGSFVEKEQAEQALFNFQQTGAIKSKRKPRAILQISIDGTPVAKYENCAAASRATGVCASNIIRCAHGNSCRKQAGGYRWEFAT